MLMASTPAIPSSGTKCSKMPPPGRHPRQGELWWFDPDPVRGTEFGKKVRPALIVSIDAFNSTGSKAVVVPGTTQHHDNPLHVPFTYRLNGAPVTTYFCCDNVRSIDARARLIRRMAPNPVPSAVLDDVQRRLALILDL
jgi:mRNA interferase MazF